MNLACNLYNTIYDEEQKIGSRIKSGQRETENMSSRLCFCCLNVAGFHFAYAPEFLKVDSPLKLGIDLRPILFVFMINSNIRTNLLIRFLN